MASLTPAETIRRERAEIAARTAILRKAIAEPPKPGPATAATVPDAPMPLASRFRALAGRFRLGEVDEKALVSAQRDAEAEKQAAAALATAAALAEERDKVGREAVQDELNQLHARDTALGVQLAAMTREQIVALLETKAAKVHACYRAAGEAVAELVATNNVALDAEVAGGIPIGRRRSIPMQPFDSIGGLPAWPQLQAFRGFPYPEATLSFDSRLKNVPGHIVVDCAPIEARVNSEIAALD